MIFTYWINSEISDSPSAGAWKKLYPGFRVFNDEDVVGLLPSEFVPIYSAIRLPSAKSDLARLMLLRRYGGLYVDAHFGPTAPENLTVTVEKLSEYNMILFGKGWAMHTDTDFDLMNGVLAARRGSHELDVVIEIIISNISEQWNRELSTIDYIPYDLFFLTGTYTLIQSFFDQSTPRPSISSKFAETVHVHYMKDNISSGFEIAAFYNYRKPGEHWSERQKKERFFSEISNKPTS